MKTINLTDEQSATLAVYLLTTTKYRKEEKDEVTKWNTLKHNSAI